MELALEAARSAAELGEVPVGAVVVRDGEVLAVAHNRRELDQDPTAHAEILALREASKKVGSWRLERCELYVTLEPCAMCTGAILLARIERCIYGATDPKGGYLGTVGDLSNVPELNHVVDVVPGVKGDESSQLLKGFFRALRKRKPTP